MLSAQNARLPFCFSHFLGFLANILILRSSLAPKTGDGISREPSVVRSERAAESGEAPTVVAGEAEGAVTRVAWRPSVETNRPSIADFEAERGDFEAERGVGRGGCPNRLEFRGFGSCLSDRGPRTFVGRFRRKAAPELRRADARGAERERERS